MSDPTEFDGICANCNGEGVVLGCSWDWQCDTYDAGEGNCLCERPCDWCNPSKPDEGRAVPDHGSGPTVMHPEGYST